MDDAGISGVTTRRDYEHDLENLKYLERTAGGWQLTPASRQDSIITIRVTPAQNRADVVRGLGAALQQFKPLATLEIEE